MSFALSVHDFLAPDVFCAQRAYYQERLRLIKKDRRLPIGPDVTLHFENKDTVWWQIQEMIRVEKGTLDNIADEISAYTPLLPQKHSDGSMQLTATLMIEIDDPIRRRRMLYALSHIERHIALTINGHHPIYAEPDCDVERTTGDGKTSAVHFLTFNLSDVHSQSLREPDTCVSVESTHPEYTYKALLSGPHITALITDCM
jgi:hypothetical protein